jgi:predicted enzyme related to lactoylglutathione lyase
MAVPSRVIHFEIQAENPQRASTFYQRVFGWEIAKWGGPIDYWLCTTGPDSERGINGGLLLRRGPAPAEGQPVNAFVCTLQVENLDQSLARAQAEGGTLAVPKMPVPGIGWLAYIKDTEGNILGLMQPDPAAK